MDARQNSNELFIQNKSKKINDYHSDFSKLGKDRDPINREKREGDLMKTDIAPEIMATGAHMDQNLNRNQNKNQSHEKKHPDEIPPRGLPEEVPAKQTPEEAPTRKKMDVTMTQDESQSHSLLDDVKTTMNDLTKLFKNFSLKKDQKNNSIKDIIENVSGNLKHVKNDLEHLYSHLAEETTYTAVSGIVKAGSVLKKQWEKFICMCVENWESIKGFVKVSLHRLKYLPRMLQETFSLQLLKLKLVVLEIRIFLLENRNALILQLA